MKLVCIKNNDRGSVPWTKEAHYRKLKVGEIYEGHFITNDRVKFVYLEKFDHKFVTHQWFITLEEWREQQLDKIL